MRGWLDTLEKAARSSTSRRGRLEHRARTIARLLAGTCNRPVGHVSTTSRTTTSGQPLQKGVHRRSIELPPHRTDAGPARDTHPRETGEARPHPFVRQHPPKIVKTGPCKETSSRATRSISMNFRAPYWNRLDGGRYLMTYGGCVQGSGNRRDERRRLSRHDHDKNRIRS